MQQQAMLDKLSEFLMVEQGGLQLYRVVAERSATPALRSKYQEFGRETARHREVLIKLITTLGGDPDYVSPTARLAQYKASKLLESALQVDGLSQSELEISDLENVLLAETKDHADWHLLQQMAHSATGELQASIRGAVDQVEDEEDAHLEWARETLAQMCMQMLQQEPAPSPRRWQARLTGPEPPITEFHPAPFTEGLLEGSRYPVWLDTPISRSVRAGSR